MNEELYFCRVCALRDEVPPWGEDGHLPVFEMCDCCGVEHGYQDCLPEGCRKFRAEWIAQGAKWLDSKMRPQGWDLNSQLQNIPALYR